MAKGACVVGFDRAADVADTFDEAGWAGEVVDVTDADEQRAAVARAVERFGGVDIAVLCAGIFPESATVADSTGRCGGRRGPSTSTPPPIC